MADEEPGRFAPIEGNRIFTPGTEPVKIRATPFVWRDPTTIPRRRWLLGFMLRRKQLTAYIAPGAAGKTTLKVGLALSMVTGRDFLGYKVWEGPYRVWLINLEDDREEVEKIIHAYCKHWGISGLDIGDRLFLDGVDSPDAKTVKIAIEDERGGYVIRRPVVDAMTETLLERGIDWLDVDPFVSSHSVNENNNGAVDAVAKEWIGIAHVVDCALSLTHHIRKPSGSEPSAYDARGAVAMINAARSVPIIHKMTKEQAQELAIPEADRKKYISVYDDKNNKCPAALAATWFEFVGVDLNNGDQSYPPGDNVGMLVPWVAPDSFGGVTVHQLRNVQMMVSSKPEQCRKHSASPKWVGRQVAFVLDMNIDDLSDKARIKKYVDTWLANGALRSEIRPDAESKRDVEFVIVGQWAEVEKN